MRKRLYEILEVSKNGDKASAIYDAFMMIVIIVSLIPLAFKTQIELFTIIDMVTVTIFIIDYIARLITADYKIGKGIKSFFIYPFTFMAIIDLVSILPSLTVVQSGWRILKIFRFFRTIRVFRVFKAVRYSKSITIFMNVFNKEKEALITICVIAIAYILISALIIMNVEPETFNTYFDAIYWATISLTTMGYGDIYPVTVIGKIVTMISSLLGIAVIAMPAGVITAGFMDELKNKQ